MGTRRLLLISSILISIVILFAMIDLMPSSTEGTYGAYFTRVKYPEIAYSEKDTLLTLVVHNKNCTTNSEDYGSFFLKFYLDGDLWWNEYNGTEYKTWQCGRGNSTALGYSIPSWNIIKPIVHDVQIELYWHDGNESLLQDIVSFPVTVVIRVEPSNLMIFSYMIVYLFAILFLGFYMLIAGRIQISSEPPQKANIAVNQQSNRIVSFLPKLRYFFLFFYLFVFASWQIINALFYVFSLTETLRESLYLIAQIVYNTLLVLVIKKENSSFRKYGYLWPEETHKYILGSLLLAISYSLITIVIPGSFTGYDVFPSPPFTGIFLTILLALATSFTSEMIFRGYIQSKLTRIIGFPLALLITSTMFALYTLPLLPFGSFHFFYEILSLFVLGIFLGILFYKTKTLLCPIIFYFTILILESLTPIKSVTSEYARLSLEFAALAFSSLLLSVLILRKVNSFSNGDQAY